MDHQTLESPLNGLLPNPSPLGHCSPRRPLGVCPMRDMALVALAIGFISLGGVIHLQQNTIEEMLMTQIRDTAHQAQVSRDLAAIQRKLARIKPEQFNRIDHIALQADLLMAMKRSGPGGERKLLKDRKIRFYLGM